MKWKWFGRETAVERGPGPEVAEPGPAPTVDRETLLRELVAALDDPFRARVAVWLREVVGQYGMPERPRLDERVRRWLGSEFYRNPPRWMVDPDYVRRLPLPAGTEAAVMGMLSSVPNGYVREAAVQRLALLGGGEELAPLLVRASDWAAPVRGRALDALRARVRPEYARAWVDALPLVLRLRGTRGEGRALVDAVLALLREPAAREAVWAGMHGAPDVGVRRLCFRILLDGGRAALGHLVRTAQHNTDAVIRLEGARAAGPLDDGTLADVLPRMLADPLGRVRMAALPLAADRLGQAGLPLLRAALLDRSPGVRGEARAALARLEPMDFAAYYRAHVEADGPRLAESVAGLAETGTAEDADAVRPLLAHARPRVRIAVLRALARLEGDAATDALVAALGDESAGVSRAAVDALRGRARRVNAGALAAWLGASNPVRVRRNALALLALRGKWDALFYILHAVADADPEMRREALGHLHRWRARFNRTFNPPSAAEQERIRTALDAAGDLPGTETLRWLRFVAGIA